MASHTYSTCQGAGCGALILWCTTAIGRKPMPLDVEPAPDGNVVLIRQDDGLTLGRVLTGEDLPARGLAYRPHHRSCVAAAEFRQRRPSAGPKCRAGCGVPMDPWLSDHGWAWHINCAPEPATVARPDVARVQAEQQFLPEQAS